MASAGRISRDSGHPARGLNHARSALGSRLESIRRYVLGAEGARDPFGHGLTQLHLGRGVLVIAPGPNEDHLELSREPVDEAALSRELWARFEIENVGKWSRFIGQRLERVDCFSDGFEDVALVFYFEAGDHLSVALCNTDAVFAEGLEPFQDELEDVVPRFRERLERRGPRPVDG